MKFPVLRPQLFGIDGRPPHGGRGLKCPKCYIEEMDEESPPARGAWIEIGRRRRGMSTYTVAPRTGGVD